MTTHLSPVDDVKALMRSMEHEINDRAGIPIGLELKEL